MRVAIAYSVPLFETQFYDSAVNTLSMQLHELGHGCAIARYPGMSANRRGSMSLMRIPDVVDKVVALDAAACLVQHDDIVGWLLFDESGAWDNELRAQVLDNTNRIFSASRAPGIDHLPLPTHEDAWERTARELLR